MNLSKIIKDLCKDQQITVSELSRRVKQSPQNLGKKLNNETLNFREFQELLDALGAKFDYSVSVNGDEKYSSSLNEEKIALMESKIELDRRYTDYLLGLAWSMRTPVNTISGSSEIAVNHIKDQKRVEDCLEKIKTAADQLVTILHESLDMSIIEGVRPEFTEAAETGTVDSETIKGRRILLVEDNELNRTITKDVLEDNGLVVETAGDGSIALEMVKNAEPGYYDCILMDVQMPVMDGLEATKRIRALPNRIRAGVPIVALTANAFEEDRQRSIDSGMDAQLIKPVEGAKIVQMISHFI